MSSAVLDKTKINDDRELETSAFDSEFDNEKDIDNDLDLVAVAEQAIKKYFTLSTEDILNMFYTSEQLDPASPMFILPGGEILSVSPVLRDSNLNYEPAYKKPMHEHLVDCIIYSLIYEQVPNFDDVMFILEFILAVHHKKPDMLKYLTGALDWARINCGTQAIEKRFYCVLPDKLTKYQEFTLADWLEWGEVNNKRHIQVFIARGTEFKYKEYDLKLLLSDGVLNRIKRFYASGQFYENYEEDNDSMNMNFLEALSALDALHEGAEPKDTVTLTIPEVEVEVVTRYADPMGKYDRTQQQWYPDEHETVETTVSSFEYEADTDDVFEILYDIIPEADVPADVDYNDEDALSAWIDANFEELLEKYMDAVVKKYYDTHEDSIKEKAEEQAQQDYEDADEAARHFWDED